MLETLAGIGWRPIFFGTLVLVIAAVAGWGMAGDRGFAPAHWLHWWIGRIILPGLRHGSWFARLGVIFLNNASICALVIAAGSAPAGAWAAIVAVGLSLGSALRMLTDPRWEFPIAVEPPRTEQGGPAAPDRVTAFAVLVNMLELPAIALTLGLAMGRRAVPNGLSADAVWLVYACWVVPLLLIAAGGEALWIGRRRPF
ncbi:MAG TPA: hypothetical protein P5572_08890 [Phycisphaerae bacterium]|nr:hypothetical protein [Phycisphaerae bacterium]